ncbi:MAG TPA: SpoIIE family protein phosphatase [Streptosporangiaceae bacterium]
MTGWRDAAFPAYLPADTVLDQVETAVVVTDRLNNLLYANAFAQRLFGVSADAHQLVGRPVLSLGFEVEDLSKAVELARQVLRGRAWEGTIASRRADGARIFVRASAVPLRHPSGAIDGIVIFAREATRRNSEREQERIGLLERIGERLSGSLELGVTLRHVADTLVPQFADHCFIDLIQGDKLVRRASTHARGWSPKPGSWAGVGEPIKYPEGHFCQQAMTRFETVLVADMAEERFPAPNRKSKQICDEIGLLSVVAAPLLARGELLGVMSLGLSRLTEREEQHYDAYDRDFLSAIASRVAVAIDNSMLFEEERRTALAFQKSLLPQSLPDVDGLRVACRYVPAKPLEIHGQGIQTQVGGDWYDIIPLCAGRVGIVIGDVEGRGARAAAIMGQLRAALRAFAQDDKPPAEILRKLDEWVRTLGPAHPGLRDELKDPPIVSCTCLVYDPWSRELLYANAGHEAPLLIVDGKVGVMEIAHGVLLGVRSPGIAGVPTFREESMVLPPGSTLVFYTDGLTDRRTRADGLGHYTEVEALEMLRTSVATVAGNDVEAIAQAAEEAVPGEIDDDMAIVVVQSSPVDLATWQASFPAEPIRVSEARKSALTTLVHWGVDQEQAKLACLLVSEVVTNAVLHAAAAPSPRREFAFETAGGAPGAAMLVESWEERLDEILRPAEKELILRLRRGASSIWVEVFDPDLRLPRIRSAGETDEGGRGLYLVDQLATRWGARPTKDGKAVWFEIPINSAVKPR